jgi:hypothetical protein
MNIAPDWTAQGAALSRTAGGLFCRRYLPPGGQRYSFWVNSPGNAEVRMLNNPA